MTQEPTTVDRPPTGPAAAPAAVDAVLSFAKRPGEHGHGHGGEVPPEYRVDGYEVALVKAQVRVHDARPIADELSLDVQGFQLVKHGSRHAAERDVDVLRQHYLDEVAAFVKEQLGADCVIPRRKGFYLRNAGPKVGAGQSLPAGYVHIDYAQDAGPVLAETENKLQGLPNRRYSRLLIIQAWRSVSPPPQDLPLALCDARSLLPDDTAEKDGGVGQRDVLGNAFRSQIVFHSPGQRWYYFSNMTPDEMILFKSYDSEADLYRRVPHSAFDNRAAFPNATPRESMEGRFFVYFD